MDSEIESDNIVNPLLNVHIIEKVFDYLKLPTLVNCRLVSRTWNEETLRILERRGITAFLKGENSLLNFMACIKNSVSHPFTSFAIDLPTNKDSEEVYELLQVLSDCMKSLKFEYEPLMSAPEPDPDVDAETEEDDELDGNHRISTISNTHNHNQAEANDPNETETENWVNATATAITSVSDREKCDITLPELTSLHLFSTNIFPPKSTNRMPQLFDLIKTPSLTSLSVQHLYATECAETVIKFLSSSKKPINALKIPCTEFPKICGHSSVSLTQLKDLDICDLFHGSFATNQTIQSIRESCPNLQTLSIELGCHVNFDNVFKLLEVLSHSIVNLKLVIQDKHLLSRNIQRVNWYFPELPKLKTLFLRFMNPGIVYYIDAMPQLTSLELETPWTRRVRGNIFPGLQTKIYTGLRTLNLSEKLTVEDVIKMHEVFPNLRNLCASFKCDEALLEIYKYFKKLENLIVDRNSSISDLAICGKLEGRLDSNLELEVPEPEPEPETINETGEKDPVKVGSIAELKCLKSLKLIQAGLTWRSVVAACYIKSLQTLAIQSTTLKVERASILENDYVPKFLSKMLPKLGNLSIWIRRNVERLSPEEMEHLVDNYPQWDIDVPIQTVCSIINTLH